MDAISCTYDTDGFTLMNAVLIAYGLDRDHFRKISGKYEGGKFMVTAHVEMTPIVITTTKTERWDSEPTATEQILHVADCEGCGSLCLTHFAFILGQFPLAAFERCLRSVELAKFYSGLKKIVVDVDERYYQQALDVHLRVLKNATDGLRNQNS
ncbi:hypothetical protein [Rhodoferax sp.]|uniref:hypothetical protein n=1 Tax=Rhodoferax sp. TaxID=50421 RepID=UPI0027301869|nr:hypothetical protein [Rhodoferax sp.]MDP2443765.1 hypothetical protein [Rhodoferax sp.]